MKRTVGIVVVLLILGWAIVNWKTPAKAPELSTPQAPISTPLKPSNTTSPASSDTTTPVVGEKSETGNIVVEEPLSGASVASPFLVKGQARVFENQLVVRLTNKAGTKLFEFPVMSHAKDVGQFGTFTAHMKYQFANTKEGFVEVFNYSAKDGTPENMVRIPVQYR